MLPLPISKVSTFSLASACRLTNHETLPPALMLSELCSRTSSSPCWIQRKHLAMDPLFPLLLLDGSLFLLSSLLPSTFNFVTVFSLPGAGRFSIVVPSSFSIFASSPKPSHSFSIRQRLNNFSQHAGSQQIFHPFRSTQFDAASINRCDLSRIQRRGRYDG